MAESAAAVPADFRVENHGTIVLLVPQTDDGRTFATDHLSHAMRFHDAYCIESRYVAAIIEGAAGEGLTFE